MTSDQFCSNLLRDMRILFPWVWSNFLWVPVPWTINEYTVSIINKLNIKILFLSASYLRKNCLPRRTRRSPGSETYSLTCETKTYFTRCRTQRMAFPVYVSSILLSLNRMIHSWITFDLLDYTPWWPWWPQRRCPTKCLLQRKLPPLWTRSSLRGTCDHFFCANQNNIRTRSSLTCDHVIICCSKQNKIWNKTATWIVKDIEYNIEWELCTLHCFWET